MKTRNIVLAVVALVCGQAHAQSFDTYFEDNTLRIDYQFSGDAQHQEIAVDQLNLVPRWFGKRHLPQFVLHAFPRMALVSRSQQDKEVVRECVPGAYAQRYGGHHR